MKKYNLHAILKAQCQDKNEKIANYIVR